MQCEDRCLGLAVRRGASPYGVSWRAEAVEFPGWKGTRGMGERHGTQRGARGEGDG